MTKTFRVQDLLVKLKNAIESDISKCVPVNTIGTKMSVPWLTKEIKTHIHKEISSSKKYKRTVHIQIIQTNLKIENTNQKSDQIMTPT